MPYQRKSERPRTLNSVRMQIFHNYPSLQYMIPVYSIWSQSTVYDPSLQYMIPVYSLWSQSTVYDPSLQYLIGAELDCFIISCYLEPKCLMSLSPVKLSSFKMWRRRKSSRLKMSLRKRRSFARKISRREMSSPPELKTATRRRLGR